MKRKNFCAKALVVMLCLAFCMSCLFACASKDDVESLDGKIGELTTELDALKTFADQVDAVAKAAVATADFEQALDELNTSIAAKADATKVAEDLTAAKTALEALIASNATKDAETVEALNAAVARITVLEESVATKAALDEAVAAINAAVATNKTEAEAKIAAVEALVKANGENDAAIKAALDELAATVEKNNTDVTAAIASAKTELEGKVTDVNKVVEELSATVKQNNESVVASIESINNAIVALEKADADNKAALEKALDDEVAALNKIITDNANAATGSISALQGEVDAIETKLAADVQAVNDSVDAKIATLKTELNAKIDGIGTELDALSTKVETVEGKVSVVETNLTALQSTVASLQEALAEITGSTDSFRNDYQAATALLVSGQTYTGEDGKVIEDMYSLAYFNRLVATIDKNYYADEDYEAFAKSVEDIRFFLNRAVSVTNVIENFNTLQGLIDAMPTLQQSLKKELDAITVITVDYACVSKAVAIYDKIVANSLELSEELKGQYLAVIGAYDNIVAADDDTTVEDLIAAIATPMVYKTSETAVEEAEAALATYVETYFSNEEYVAYYEDSEATLVEGYDDLLSYRERLDQLAEADENKVEIIEVAFSACPLYTNYEALVANNTAVEEWKIAYEIDDVNYAVIYGGDEIYLADALAYATAMYNIYVEYDVVALNAGIDGLLAKNYALYDDIGEAYGYAETYENVAKAINEVAGDKAEEDQNEWAMIAEGQAEGTSRYNDFIALLARLDALADAKKAIDEINNAMVELLNKEGGVAISDYVAIKDFRAELDAIYLEYKITVEVAVEGEAEEIEISVAEPENYAAIATEAEANYDALIDAYNGATEEVAKAYAAVKNRLDNIEWLLKDGAEIDGIIADLQSLINMGVVDATLITVSGDIEVDIPALLSQYINAANEYGINATAAAEAAVTVKEAVAAALELDSTDINNYATIVVAYEAVEEWIETYLAADVEAAEGDVVAALNAIQNIHILGTDGETYVFVIADEYTEINTANDTVVSAYESAEEAWIAIKADMETLAAEYDIHSYEDTEVNFVAVKKAYDEYVDTYYKDNMTNIFEEAETVDAFNEAMADCSAKCEAADGAAEVINSMIAGIGEITMDNAAEVLETIASIDALVADYEANYCTDGCKFVDAEGNSTLDTLAIAEYKAEVNAAYAERIDELAANGQDTSKALTAVNSYNQMFANATTVTGAQYVHQFAISDLDNYPVIVEEQPAD